MVEREFSRSNFSMRIPWKKEDSLRCSRGVGIVDRTGESVVSVMCEGCQMEDERLTEADADFIIAACNSYFIRVSALKVAKTMLETGHYFDPVDGVPSSKEEILVFIQQALDEGSLAE